MSFKVDSTTVHTITVTVPDEVLAKIQEGDEVRLMLEPRVGAWEGRIPAPMRLSYTWVRYLTRRPY